MNTSRKLFAFFGGIAAVVTLAFLMGPTGGLPSRPVFQSVTLRQANPILEWHENDAGADHGRWACRASGEQFVCGTRDDDGTLSAANEFFQINRDLGASSNLTNTTIQGRADGVLIQATDAGTVDVIGAGGVSFEATTGNVSLTEGGVSRDIATIEVGSYTGTLTGCTTAPTITIFYTLIGNRLADGPGGIVSMMIPTQTCTSNATTFTVTGAPAEIRPNATTGGISQAMFDNGTGNTYNCRMNTAGTYECLRNASLTGWTASGSKGFPNAVQTTYSLDNS